MFQGPHDPALCLRPAESPGGFRKIGSPLVPHYLSEKEKVIVIQKSEKPRCFHSVKKESLPVEHYTQKSGDTLDTVHVLQKAN